MQKSREKVVYTLLILYVIILVFLYIYQRKNVNSIIKRFLNIHDKGDMERFTVKEKINNSQDAIGIIAISLFGDFSNLKIYEKYVKPLFINGPKIQQDFPGFYIRVYIDPRTPRVYIDELVSKNFQVYIMDKPTDGTSGMFWRFLAFEEPGKRYTFISDSDTVINYENSATYPKLTMDTLRDWESSGKKFIARGTHRIYVPFSANRIGMRDYKISNIQDLMDGYTGKNYGDDEVFLKKEIYPIMKKEGLYRVSSNERTIFISISIVVILPLIVILLYLKKFKY